jgi:hypothetical protein
MVQNFVAVYISKPAIWSVLTMERMRKKKKGAVTITEVGRTLEDWVDWLEKAYGEGMIELDDLDKVELLELLKELEKRRQEG